MQPHPTPQPESLKDLLLLLLIERAIRLAAPALVDTPRTPGSLYHRLVDVLSLATQLIHRLPRLAEALARRQHGPARSGKPERAEAPERADRPENTGGTRALDVPALVARISGELLAIAKLLGPDAHDELTALARRVQQAAQSWQPPETASKPSAPSPCRPNTAETHRLDASPCRKTIPDLLTRGQGSG